MVYRTLTFILTTLFLGMAWLGGFSGVSAIIVQVIFVLFLILFLVSFFNNPFNKNSNMEPSTKSETEILEKLKNMGFDRHFFIKENKLHDADSNKTYFSDEVKILEEFRCEGKSNPDDLSIIYGIETAQNTRGSMVIPYGPSGNTEAALFMKEVEEKVQGS